MAAELSRELEGKLNRHLFLVIDDMHVPKPTRGRGLFEAEARQVFCDWEGVTACYEYLVAGRARSRLASPGASAFSAT